MKNINFLCGLPRSGSTLLATLLNQHPEIYASPHSALVDGLWAMRKAFIESEAVKFQLRLSAYQETLWTVPQIFYSGIKENIIFDKQFTWTTPDNYEMALKISNNPRFLVCYRPVLEILTSFVSKSIDNPEYYLNKQVKASDFYAKNYLSHNDAMAEYLMTVHGILPKSLFALANAKKNEDSGRFKFVSYDDLTNDPKKEMLSIFDFLGLEPIEVQTENLEDLFRYKDFDTFGVEGFHKVRPVVKKESPKPEEYFSDFILEKYANALAPMGL